MVESLRPEVNKGKDKVVILEDLLNRLLAKDTKEGIGCDNMTSLLIKFKK